MHPGMLFALLGADATGGLASLQQHLGNSTVISGPAGEDIAGGGTDVSAVQIGSDAPGQPGDHLFALTGVRARGTGLGAFEARRNAFREFLCAHHASTLGMGIKHGADVLGHDPAPVTKDCGRQVPAVTATIALQDPQGQRDQSTGRGTFRFACGQGAAEGLNVTPPSVETMIPPSVAAQIQGFPSPPLTAAIARTWPSIRPFLVQVAPASAE